jgi:hypothetical protein
MSSSTMPAVWGPSCRRSAAWCQRFDRFFASRGSRRPQPLACRHCAAPCLRRTGRGRTCRAGSIMGEGRRALDRLGCTYHSATAQVRATEEALRSGELAAAQDPPIRSHDAASRLGATTLVGVVRQLARSTPSLLTSGRGQGQPVRLSRCDGIDLRLADRVKPLSLVARGRAHGSSGEAKPVCWASEWSTGRSLAWSASTAGMRAIE